MKTKWLFLLFQLGTITGYAQQSMKDSLFSPTQLKADLAYLKQQLYQVHANPYTEFSARQYEQLFAGIESSLTQPATATDFLGMVKPAIAHLSDEHAYIGLQQPLLNNRFGKEPVFLPFVLQQRGKDYIVSEVLAGNYPIVPGTTIRAINNIPIATWIKQCTDFVSGYPNQREAAALRRFGYYFGWANKGASTSFTIGTNTSKNMTVSGVTLEDWNVFLDGLAGKTNCQERISYQQYGSTGYINACSFDIQKTGAFTMEAVQTKIDSIFKVIHEAGIKKLVIDVSNNEGGNSAVGDYLIDHFYKKPYKDYQCNWKRSMDYQKLYESWGMKNEQYANTPIGETIHFASTTTTPNEVLHPFTGKVVVVIGQHTFSSAILFATLIKDNQMAPLIGQVPANGHPNHFGEMYNTKLPNTKIELRFGVKEWIRPAGKGKEADNELRPDILLSDAEMQDVQKMIGKVK
jgi:hypothetical protein